jgi:tetratricopeptide (TPR) repeat protein
MRAMLAGLLVVLALFAVSSPASSQAQSLSKNASEVDRATGLIKQGKYPEAKSVLETYLKTHSTDRSGFLFLGVADSFNTDQIGAAKAFDNAGTIPDRYKPLAAKAYADSALAAFKEKSYDATVELSGKSLALQPSADMMYVQGTAYVSAQHYPQAITVLQKARTIVTAGSGSASSLNAIDTSLMTAYLFGGDGDKGLALAQELKRRDPGNPRIDDSLAGYYNAQAASAVAAGNREDAVTGLEKAATVLPSRAAGLYIQAANVIAGGPPDWKRVKAEADKALAIEPNNPRANYVAGVALANAHDSANAIVLLQKAKANAGTDAALNSDIDAALKRLGTRP